ncbi:MAG: sulfotransferase [Pirellulaceae bacterium]|nr:sulfotransferase [Pirellulaceae bacterium]
MSAKPASTANRYPFYSPRFWNGMRMGDYAALLSSHRFAVSWQRLPMFFLVGGCAVGNSVLAALQQWRFGKRIQHQPIEPAPIFVVGHWRSGTTLLHELLSLDDRFGYPTTLECFLPHHFLVSEPVFRPLLKVLLPSKRPMDNMPTGVDLPQEDEFALVAMGAPSPYQQIAFPNQPARGAALLNMEGLDPKVEAAFADNLTRFLQSLMLKKNKRLILKSPTHTGRIAWLAKRYPGSKFIHIARNPVEVFLSTKRLWRRLHEVQGLQIPRYSDDELSEAVHRDYQAMYHGYLNGRRALEPGQWLEVQFEQLLTDAPGIIRQIYQTLNLGDSTHLESDVAKNMSQRHSYQGENYQVPQETVADVMRRWGQYALAFGYDVNTGECLAEPSELRSRA